MTTHDAVLPYVSRRRGRKGRPPYGRLAFFTGTTQVFLMLATMFTADIEWKTSGATALASIILVILSLADVVLWYVSFSLLVYATLKMGERTLWVLLAAMWQVVLLIGALVLVIKGAIGS